MERNLFGRGPLVMRRQVGITLGHENVGMAEQLLHRVERHALHDQPGSEGVAQGMENHAPVIRGALRVQPQPSDRVGKNRMRFAHVAAFCAGKEKVRGYAAFRAGLQNAQRGAVQIEDAATGLAVDFGRAVPKVYLAGGEREKFAEPCAGKQTKGRHVVPGQAAFLQRAQQQAGFIVRKVADPLFVIGGERYILNRGGEIMQSGLAGYIEHDAHQRKYVTDGSGIESRGRAAADELREQLRSNGTQLEAAEGREKMLPGIALCRASRGLGKRVLRHVPVPGVRKQRRRAGNGGVKLRQGVSSHFCGQTGVHALAAPAALHPAAHAGNLDAVVEHDVRLAVVPALGAFSGVYPRETSGACLDGHNVVLLPSYALSGSPVLSPRLSPQRRKNLPKCLPSGANSCKKTQRLLHKIAGKIICCNERQQNGTFHPSSFTGRKSLPPDLPAAIMKQFLFPFC